MNSSFNKAAVMFLLFVLGCAESTPEEEPTCVQGRKTTCFCVDKNIEGVKWCTADEEWGACIRCDEPTCTACPENKLPSKGQAPAPINTP